MRLYLRTKFQVSSLILTSFRQRVILPPPPPPLYLKSPVRLLRLQWLPKELIQKFHFKNAVLVVVAGKHTTKDFKYSKKKNTILAENIDLASIAKTKSHPSYPTKL